MYHPLTFFLLLLFYFICGQTSHLTAQPTRFNDFINQLSLIICPKLTGRIIFPGEPGYQKARLVSNYYTSKDKFPDVIVYCQNTQDVQNAIRWARCHYLPIRVRSGGHNHEAFSTGTKVLVIDVSEIKYIHIDKSKNIAIVGAGINNEELYPALFKEGFTHVGGTCSEVSIPGLILSGGMGPLLRRHGLTCDNVVYLDIIDANGYVIHATKDNEYKDLFWASCGGGGGNFGIITSMAINIYPAKPVTWFNIGWDWNQPIEEVIHAWQDFFSKDDRRWFSHLDIWSKAFPSEKLGKQPVKVLGMFWGTPEEARRELAHFLNIGRPNTQTIELVNWYESIQLIEESTAVFLTSKPEYKSIGAFAREALPNEAIEIILKTLQNTTSPLFNVLLFSLGGATADRSPTDTAYFYRDAKFFLSYSIQWLQEKNDKKRIHEVELIRQRLLPYTEGDYVGNPDPHFEDYLKTYYGGNVRRLQCIKRKYDPHHFFKFEQSIPPAPPFWHCASE